MLLETTAGQGACVGWKFGHMKAIVDRHEHIGRGAIGIDAFRCLMRDKRFKNVPKVIETPKENDMHPVNLKLLRDLAS